MGSQKRLNGSSWSRGADGSRSAVDKSGSRLECSPDEIVRGAGRGTSRMMRWFLVNRPRNGDKLPQLYVVVVEPTSNKRRRGIRGPSTTTLATFYEGCPYLMYTVISGRQGLQPLRFDFCWVHYKEVKDESSGEEHPPQN